MLPARRLLLAACPIGRAVNRHTPAGTHPASRREAAEHCRKECSALAAACPGAINVAITTTMNATRIDLIVTVLKDQC
jgi:hypothetical protein